MMLNNLKEFLSFLDNLSKEKKKFLTGDFKILLNVSELEENEILEIIRKLNYLGFSYSFKRFQENGKVKMEFEIMP